MREANQLLATTQSARYDSISLLKSYMMHLEVSRSKENEFVNF